MNNHKSIVLLIIGTCLAGLQVFSQTGNYVFSGNEAVNFGVLDLATPGAQTWATDRAATPGYFSAVGTATYSGAADAAANINGYAKYYADGTPATSYIFPVGSGTDLRTLTIATIPATGIFATAWILGNPGGNLDPTTPNAGAHAVTAIGPDISKVNATGQWDWQDISGNGSGVVVTVSIPDVSAFSAASMLRLVGWNGTQWVNLSTTQGSSAASGNTENSTLTGTMIAGITAIAIGSTEITIGGTIYDDANGMNGTPGQVDGTGTNAGSLNAILVNTGTGLVTASVPVPANGIYSFGSLPSADYTVRISTNAGTMGAVPPAVSLPLNWVSTGEHNSTTITTGDDGTANSLLALGAINTIITAADFGIDRLPSPTMTVANIPVPVVVDKITLDGNSGNPPYPSGNDPEDGPLGSGSAIVITTVPTNSKLLYNNVDVLPGQVIASFNPSLLQLDITAGTVGSVSTAFTFGYRDAAGKESAAAESYTLSWGVILPVKLLSFDAAISGRDVVVNWQTAQEQNNDRFEIEYSADGILFKKAGEVKSKGDSEQTLAYSFVHKNAAALDVTVLYYRLKQSDKDGRHDYSRIVKLILQPGKQVKIYPNPVKRGTMLTLSAQKIKQVSVYNINGQLVWQQAYNAESSLIAIPTGRFSQGSYVIRINGNEVLGRFIVME